MPLLLAFILVPLIEIALFVQIGGAIGLWWTLATVLLTAIAGASLVRQQGADILARLQSSLNTFRDPTHPLAEGAMVLFSGALLLTPGFFTDIIGFALLVPAVRRAIIARVGARVQLRTAQMHSQHTAFHDTAQPHPRHPAEDVTIDGEYDVHEPDANTDPTRHGDKGTSGWTRH